MEQSMSLPLRRAFTLIELLVVVGIIGVLIGMLLPSLAKARDSANQTRCAVNMRQIGGAIVLYATDFNDAIVPASIYSIPDGANSWDTLLAPQLGATLLASEAGLSARSTHMPYMQCPIDRFVRTVTTVPIRSYAMVRGNPGSPGNGGKVFTTSGWTCLANINGTNPVPWPGSDGQGYLYANYQVIKFTQVLRPSMTLLLAEYFIASNYQGRHDWCTAVDRPQAQMDSAPNGRNPMSHNNGHFNYVFADNHVESLLPAETIQPTASYGSALNQTNYNIPNYMWARE